MVGRGPAKQHRAHYRVRLDRAAVGVSASGCGSPTDLLQRAARRYARNTGISADQWITESTRGVVPDFQPGISRVDSEN